MDKGHCHHEDMGNRLRLEPYIKFSGKEVFRNPRGIKASSGDVRDSHEEEPAHLAHCGDLGKVLTQR